MHDPSDHLATHAAMASDCVAARTQGAMTRLREMDRGPVSCAGGTIAAVDPAIMKTIDQLDLATVSGGLRPLTYPERLAANYRAYRDLGLKRRDALCCALEDPEIPMYR